MISELLWEKPEIQGRNLLHEMYIEDTQEKTDPTDTSRHLLTQC